MLSRGDSARIYARDGPYAPDILWTSFSANLCKTLAGKPKLLLIQGGNSNTFNNGAIVHRRMEEENDYKYNIPAMSDILIMYSTYKGKLSVFQWLILVDFLFSFQVIIPGETQTKDLGSLKHCVANLNKTTAIVI